MERISAFMDGEAGQAETHHALLRLKQDTESNQIWAAYHLIGDTMRGDPLLRDDFMARFHARMESEPTQLAPRMSWREAAAIFLSHAIASAGVSAATVTPQPNAPSNAKTAGAVARRVRTASNP